MSKKALLVGINYLGTEHALRGCVNDVMLMSSMLTKHFGFKSKEKRMLTDSSATTKNILARLEWLVKGAKAGDVLFFHFSGHGSQTIDTKYDSDDEPDGLDEIICPVDLNWRDKVIKDDDLKRIFNKVPIGVNLTVILDCCHSGSGLDHQYRYQPLGPGVIAENDPMSPERARLIEMPADISNRGMGLELSVKPRAIQNRPVNSTGLLISGCQANQTSADAYINRKFQGAATFFINKVLSKHKYDIDYKTLIEKVNEKLNKSNYTQRPELNGAPSLFSGKFLQPTK